MKAIQEHLKGTYGTMYYVRDMKKAVKFYKENVGLEAGMESEHWTEFKTENGKMLCLHLADSQMKSLPGGIMILQVTGLKDLVQKLRANNVELTGEPHCVHEHDYTTDFVDGDGNLVSLYGTL